MNEENKNEEMKFKSIDLGPSIGFLQFRDNNKIQLQNLNFELKNVLDKNINFNKSLIQLKINEEVENEGMKLKFEITTYLVSSLKSFANNNDSYVSFL